MTCDRFPKELDGLDDRLKSRFSWGLTVSVEPPDLETRVAILLSKAELLGFELQQDIALFIAQRIRTNVRELEGALNTLRARVLFTRESITMDFARATLKDLLAAYERLVTIDNIMRVVSDLLQHSCGRSELKTALTLLGKTETNCHVSGQRIDRAQPAGNRSGF